MLTSICGLNYLINVFLYVNRVAEPVLKNRNFDPESRTLKKHTANDVVMEDTVENQVKGMAVEIIADDERQRAQELVRFPYSLKLCLTSVFRMSSISHQSDQIGI